jgi:rhamnosyltransferase
MNRLPVDFIAAIVVTFNPNREKLRICIEAVLPQVDRLIIVDNGSAIDMEEAEQVVIIPLGDNRGVAVAQNAGIDWARQHCAGYVILFDQDSEPAPDMVEKLVSAYKIKQAEGFHVAAVGPRYLDERQQNPPPFIQIRGLRIVRQKCSSPEAIVEVDYVISSGCLIPLPVLEKVGGMRNELFIDYVDIEWGLRAKYHGFKCFGACAAHMRHDLGDEPIEFFGRKIPNHSPLRHYYHFRNAVWLYRQNWPPLWWRIGDALRLIRKYVFYSLFTRSKLEHFCMMTIGVWHGFQGHMGKYCPGA